MEVIFLGRIYWHFSKSLFFSPKRTYIYPLLNLPIKYHVFDFLTVIDMITFDLFYQAMLLIILNYQSSKIFASNLTFAYDLYTKNNRLVSNLHVMCNFV